MDTSIFRYCLSLILLTAMVTSAEINDTNSDQPREPRVSGRIVKLYSGARPEPYHCASEGFQADPSNCAAFYRCVKERSGKFTVFKYQCAPGTVFDPDLETCNHPRSTRRTECGGILQTIPDPHHTTHINEIGGEQSELPRPISTKASIYPEQTTFKTPSTVSWNLFTNRKNLTTEMSWVSMNSSPNTYITSETTKLPAYTTNNQWFYTTHTIPSASILPPKITQRPNQKNTEPCTSDGFIGDSDNCRKFYRCVRNLRGKYEKFEFLCSETTVWDDEIQSCNHPWAVKRSKCGRSMIFSDRSESIALSTTEASIKDSTAYKGEFGYKFNKTIQQQLQISHGSEVTQTQVQISNSQNVIQNQTQINYGDKVQNGNNSKSKQNQTQLSHGTGVSQSQTQIDYGNKGVQTQLQIDHSKDSSQSQVQESATQSTTSTTKNNSAGKNECSESGFMGDSNDCKKFYRCVNNGRGSYIRYEYLCGDGTLWDPEIEACNHAWAVKHCGGKVPAESITSAYSTYTPEHSTQQTRTTTSYKTSPVSDDEDDIGYGNQNNQDISSTTSTAKTSTTEISTTMVQTSTTTTSTTRRPNEATTECIASGFMGDVNDCRIFYRCVDNGNGGFIKYEFKCGDGTVWDPNIEACNHAWAVKSCGGSNTQKEETTTKKDNTTPLNNVITTVNLVQITTQSTTQVDDYETGYGLQNHEPTTAKTTTTFRPTKPPEDTGKGSYCKSSGFMGDENDCKKFYRCVDNGNGGYVKYEFTCGAGTVWDSKIEACNHAWAVENCGESQGNESESDYETTSQSSSTQSSTTVTDSSNIHTTVNGKETEKPMTITSTTSSSTTLSSSSSKCSKSGFMGDSGDCKKFYRCVDNGDGSYIRYEFTCGDGTVWDAKIEACNHAWAVEKCGGEEHSEFTPTTQETTQIMQDEEHDNGYATPSHEASETSQNTTSTSSSSPNFTPAGESGLCENSGFMGDRNNCKKFYRCVDNGKGGFDRYEFMCGEGTVWDESIEACNHAWAVKNCRESGISTTNKQNENTTPSVPSSSGYEQVQVSTEKTTTTTKSQQESGQSVDDKCEQEGFYGNQSDCKKFYRCVDNGKGGFTKYEFMCGEGTSWNSNIQNCDYISPDRPCGSSKPQQTTTQESTPLFDDMVGQSITTTKATTTTEGKPSQDSSQTTKKPQSSEATCYSEGFYENPSDCKKFHRCVDNGNGGYIKYDFNCGEGTVWNQEKQTCDYESGNTLCSSSSSNHHTTESQSESTTHSYSTTKGGQTTEKTKVPETTGNKCTAEGFFAHPSDCKKFVRCVDNGNGGYTQYEFSCGDGTVWVQEKQTCDHDSDVGNCNAQVGTTFKPTNTDNNSSGASNSDITSSTESMPPNKEDDEYSNEPSHDETNECTSEGFYANKQDCRRFYRCVDNGNNGYTKYDFVCGEGTAWDSDLQTCNHINEVQSCSSSVPAGNGNHQTTTSKNQAETEGTSSTTKATTSSESSSSNSNNQDTCDSEGYFGNSNDCKKFYRCVDNGKGGYTKYDYTCGDGTIWDQDITTCNHPQDVSNPSCGSSQGSGDTSSSSSTTSSTTSSSSQTTSSSTESSSCSQGTSDCSEETSKKPATNNVTCDKAGYYAHPSDCKKFYRCVDWDGDGKRFSVFHFECGEGTIWDPALDTCNYEDSVYPQRDCQTQSENVGGESSTEESPTTKGTTTSTEGTITTTTEGSMTTTTEGTTTTITEVVTTTSTESTTDEQTTQESATSKPTTAQQTTSESTTTEQSNEQTTTQKTSTSESTTTQESTTSEQTTTQQTTTQQSTTSDQTTEQPTSEQTTTQQTTSSESTTQESITSEQTTTQQTTTSEQSTTQQSSTTQESTTSEQTTTQQSTMSEQTTTQQSTSSGETTTNDSNGTTTEQSTTTTQQSTDGTTTQQTTEETTTTEQTTDRTTTTEQTTDRTSTTEQTTDGTTTTEQTTDKTTNTEQTTKGTTTAENTTDQSTTQTTTTESNSSEGQSTTEASSTTESTSSDKECPETDDDQYILVCPTSFRRHPKYCNMFYQCTEDEETYEAKMAMFKCPNDTIYDENQTQCVSENKSEKKCNGEIANKRRFKRLGSYYRDPIVADKGKQSCSNTGFFSFEKQSECAKGFLKCERSKNGELRGYVYQCPDGYTYWSISKRCEKVENVRDCKRSSNDWTGRWNIPVERHNIARS